MGERRWGERDKDWEKEERTEYATSKLSTLNVYLVPNKNYIDTIKVRNILQMAGVY